MRIQHKLEIEGFWKVIVLDGELQDNSRTFQIKFFCHWTYRLAKLKGCLFESLAYVFVLRCFLMHL